MPLPPDLTSVSLAVKMQSSKRTLRSHEIPVMAIQQAHVAAQGNSVTTSLGTQTLGSSANIVSTGSSVFGSSLTNNAALLETDLDLHFSLQYPHFIKRDGNRLLILLQRRKKYKSRTILGYKTLAEGVIRMDAVLQKSMDMTVELVTSSKNGRPGTTVATLRAERVSSIPVDQDNKNNNSVLLTDRVTEYSDEDEEGEFSSGEDNDDGTDVGLNSYDGKRSYASKHEMRKYRKLERSENDVEDVGANPPDSDSEFEIKEKGSRAKISRQRNFKQKIVALLKRFKVSEELDGGVSRGAGALRGERDLDALFQELESLSCGEGDDSGPDLDSLSVGSTPKPSLRPFFSNSRSMLHDNITGKERRRASDKGEMTDKKTITATTPDRSGPEWRNDSSGNEGNAGNTDPEAQNSDPQNTGSPPREKDISNNTASVTSTEKRSRLFRTSSSTPNTKKKQSLSLSSEPKSVLETCLSPTNVEPRKSLLEQLTRVFSMEEQILPDVVTIISPPEAYSSSILSRINTILGTSFRPAFQPQNTAEVKAVLQALMNKIQKYCNSTAKPPATIKVLLLGGDWLQGSVLRHYVDLLGVRPPDWVNHLRFYMVPIGTSSISRYLSAVDQSYCAMFGTESWQQLCDRASSSDSTSAKADILELTNRIQRYLHTAGPCTQIPIAEAMVNYKDEDSCQIFVPFVSDVRIGFLDGPQLSLDLEESSASALLQQTNSASNILSSSPPASGRTSPPLPLTPSQQQQQQLPQQQSSQQAQESVELQIDYWPVTRIGDTKDKLLMKGSDQGKNSIKSTFRNLQVWRIPHSLQLGEIPNGLTVCFATKEKKQKIMRLGKKKEKDKEQEKEQCVEGVARLICSPKQSHPVPLRVYIDGTEWTGVKFFQLSSQWQTHVKNFPVALIGATLSCSDLA